MDTNQNQAPSPQANQPGFLSQMEHFFKTYLHDKAPFHFPPNVKEFLVKFGPWITLVIIVLTLPAILFAFGVGAFVLPFAAVVTARTGMFYIVYIIFALASLALEAMALPGLFARKLSGWRLAYYAVLVSALGQLLHGEIFGAVISLIISMYVLFEIKDYYK